MHSKLQMANFDIRYTYVSPKVELVPSAKKGKYVLD